ncbi:hypothetical protein FHT02_003443 [Sphingomonas xinjiangensis]|uniref:Uncharacterized protein n=1 Tax=Sphingomonas xinjiangensis TaxID=643568 RepID=A0A840YP03_9SPHN|nr:hypothetical protein [Sphingomonas xinjiangensis]
MPEHIKQAVETMHTLLGKAKLKRRDGAAPSAQAGATSMHCRGFAMPFSLPLAALNRFLTTLSGSLRPVHQLAKLEPPCI